MSCSIRIEQMPALKMILHAAKYPDVGVNGLLLCKRQDALKINIIDYIPLLHSPLNLAPMLEVALYQVESYCNSEGLRMCGYFQANEHVEDNTPTPFACKIADKLNDKCGPACLVMLRNDRLQHKETDCFVVYTVNQGKWQPSKSFVVPDVAPQLEASLSSKIHRSICDFDDHLNDVRCDYLNSELSKCISALF
ncbi:unnamed protein product [Calicophoron daubneyi]|uniref:MPN domain-containing protein n=1 Tax=Calicophoron daubneyi TaxID=300641 RepID=A0AAV2T7L9_CALDB